MIAVLHIVPIVLEFILLKHNRALSKIFKFRECQVRKDKIKHKVAPALYQWTQVSPLKIQVGKLVCILQLLSSLTLIHVSKLNGYGRTAWSQSTVLLSTTHLRSRASRNLLRCMANSDTFEEVANNYPGSALANSYPGMTST